MYPGEVALPDLLHPIQFILIHCCTYLFNTRVYVPASRAVAGEKVTTPTYKSYEMNNYINSLVIIMGRQFQNYHFK